MTTFASLGPLEQEIMEVVWKHEALTVRCVFEVLKQDRPIAYTTVMTIMTRLAKKGFI
jgi:predicted transcriptional regulator